MLTNAVISQSNTYTGADGCIFSLELHRLNADQIMIGSDSSVCISDRSVRETVCASVHVSLNIKSFHILKLKNGRSKD